MSQDAPVWFKNHQGAERNLLKITPNELLAEYACEKERKYFWLPIRILSNDKNRVGPNPNDPTEKEKHWKNQYYEDYFRDNIDVRFSNIEECMKHHLFFFCVFSDRSQQAKQLCSQFDNPYTACLIAAKIYRRAARLIGCQDHKRSYYLREQAEDYSRLAAQYIDQTHQKNCANRSPEEFLLKSDQTFFGYKPWALIERSYCHGIHKSDLIRKYVHTIWYNGIDDSQNYIHFRVFLATIFFPLIPLLLLIPGFIPFRKDFNWFKRLKIFYTAPIVQFYYYYIFFIGFLIIHGYWIMMAYFPVNRYAEIRAKLQNFPLTRSELITHFWIFHLFIEEILEFIQSYRKHHNCCTYFRRAWNFIDCLISILYLIALILRLPPTESTFVASKILMVLTFILWCTRLLRVFSVFKHIGWCFFLIFRMLKTFICFICIILVILFAFSIGVEALLSTSKQVTWHQGPDGTYNATVANNGNGDGYEMFDWIVIKKLLDWGIWKVFGQVDQLPSVEENSYTVSAWYLTGIYVYMTNMILITALIVLLNMIGDDTKQKSKILQRYEHFLIIMDFSDKNQLPSAFRRSLLPPPLNGVWYVSQLIKSFICKVCLYSLQSNGSRNNNDHILAALQLFEDDPYLLITYSCVYDKKRTTSR